MAAEFVEHLAGKRHLDPPFGAETLKVLPGEYLVTITDLRLALATLCSARVGERNWGVMLGPLRSEGTFVAVQDPLDVHRRKVHFLPTAGRVLVKQLTLHGDTQPRRDSECAAHFTEAPVSGAIELS